MNLPASTSLLCLLMVICTEVYPTRRLEMPLTLACGLPFQDQETLVTDFFTPKDEGISSSELMSYFCPVTLINL